MWSCGPFMRSRSRSLLSHLHAVRHRISHPPVGTDVAAKRGHVSDAIDGDRAADGGHANGDDHKTPETRNRQQHLYLVLDDTKDGFGIHKVDIDENDDDVVAGTATTPERLPEPPLLRIEYPTLGDYPSFAVLGSNIIGMGSASKPSRFENRSDGVTLVFDTRTAALTIVRDHPDVYPEIAVAVANRLYMMDSWSSSDMLYDRPGRVLCDGGLHCLKLQEDADPPGSSWSWYTYSDFSDRPARWLWSDNHHLLPLSPNGIRAHALHPSGRTFFVSVHCWIYPDHRGRTFSYDTERDEWTRHGDWELPFLGQAHYDGGMRAWVGLHHARGGDPDGHLCACNVPLPRLYSHAKPHYEVCKDQLFPAHPKQHIDAKLVPMGGGGRFCLVEILTREGVSKEGCLGDGDRCVLRLSTFRVRRGDDGEELTITTRRPAGEYLLSRYVDGFEVQAFWM